LLEHVLYCFHDISTTCNDELLAVTGEF
jgi:hypothetical protein